ncbi:PBP1A family penicillin-binding protein [Bacillaceae bacterium W0354]
MKYVKQLMGKYPKLKWVFLSFISLLVLSVIGYLTIIFGGRFVVDEKNLIFKESTLLVTEDGKEVVKLYDENRTYVPINQIPEHVKNAFIAIEDHRFYDHNGVDFWAVGRAVYKDLITWSKAEGASTITQQLVKNVSLTNEKSWLRKTKEVMGAMHLERIKSKDEILEYYLNETYFGHGVHGVEEAAQFFFSKSVSELSISEGALLAALPKAPNRYSPLADEQLALERRNVVLNRMYELDMINANMLKREQGKMLGLNQGETEESPWLNTYIDIVLKEIEEKYHLSREEIYTGGYKITVGLDVEAQEIAYEHLQKNDYFHGPEENIEAAVVILDEQSGAIRAAIGGRSYKRGDLNRIYVKRQPGSTIKPLVVYGPALEQSLYEPYTLIRDELIDYNGYQPKNYDGKYAGRVTMYEALLHSKNAPAVSVLNDISVEKGKSYLKNIGIDIPDQGLSVALGGLETGLSPLQLAAAFRTIYDNGVYIEPYSVIKIENRNGDLINEYSLEMRQLFSKQTSWYLTRMLEAVVTNGTASGGSYNKALAGKTGSTEHPYQQGAFKDTWFVGFNPEYTIATWIGYDVSDEEHYLMRGSQAPTMLANDILTTLDQTKSFSEQFIKPEDVEELQDPIYLPIITDLDADLTFGIWNGLFIKLTWTASEDERIEYHIYKEKSGKAQLVGKVTGKNEYTVRSVEYFDNPSYYVVPVNPLTGQKGQNSNKIKAF